MMVMVCASASKISPLSIPAVFVCGTVMNKTGLSAACLPDTKIPITRGICLIVVKRIPPLAVRVLRAQAVIFQLFYLLFSIPAPLGPVISFGLTRRET